MNKKYILVVMRILFASPFCNPRTATQIDSLIKSSGDASLDPSAT